MAARRDRAFPADLTHGGLLPPGLARPVRSWPAYPAYKPSDVEWLGDIPAHWVKTSIKRLAKRGYKTFVDGDWIESPYITNEGVRLLQTGNVGIGEFKEQGFRYISEETFKGFRCTEILPGDVLICRLAEPVGRACIAPNLGVRMITSVDVCILKPRDDLDSRFIVYSLSSDRYLAWMQSLCRGGTRDRVSRSMLGAIEFPVPPLDEQGAIAAFLDCETAKLDALIAKHERLIELLQEKRTALISHAVTKGLDPSAPMKDSGVPWLGQIPSRWNIRRLKTLISFVTSGSRGWAQYYSDDGPLFIRIGNLTRTSIYLDLSNVEHVLPPQGAEVERTCVRKNDVLVSVTAYIGSVAVVNEDIGDAYVNQHIALTRPRTNQVDSKWLGYCLLSRVGQSQFRSLLYGGTKEGLGLDDVTNLLIIVPPFDEQKRIAGYLDRETTKLDALIARVREGIEKLREYRTALISAAVTGKIDVRDYQNLQSLDAEDQAQPAAQLRAGE